MREVEIKLTGQQIIGDTVIKIDDKPVKFKKNKFGSLVCKYQTESDKINIKVFRTLDVGGIFWFLTQIFFFLISIFGIFDVHHKERCLVIDFESEFELKEENKITLQVNSPRENEGAISIETSLISQVVSNKYYLDTNAKKLLKYLKFTKIFLILAIVIIAIIVLMVKL